MYEVLWQDKNIKYWNSWNTKVFGENHSGMEQLQTHCDETSNKGCMKSAPYSLQRRRMIRQSGFDTKSNAQHTPVNAAGLGFQSTR